MKLARWTNVVAVASACVLAACSSPQRAAEGERSAPVPSWRLVGQSVNGQPIEAMTIGSGSLQALVIGGIHGDETEGHAAIDEVIAAARANGTRWTTTLVRDMNPDGTALGTRGNQHGVDLNRNWPKPELQAASLTRLEGPV